MKNSKEIASAVFQARDEYIEQQQIRNKKIKKAAAVSGTACALCLTVVGAGYWNSVDKNLPVLDTDTASIANENSNSVIDNNSEVISEIKPTDSIDNNNNIKENADISASAIDKIPEKEVVIPDTTQINIETNNSNTNTETPDNSIPNSEIQQTSENNEISTNDNEENDVCHHMKAVIIDDVGYVEYNAGAETYTPDICLGSPSDYDGNYRAFFSHIPATLYTSKENPEILIVEESECTVYLIKTKE